MRIKQLILRGMVPPFYLDKLQLDPQTKTPTSLALSILLTNFNFFFSWMCELLLLSTILSVFLCFKNLGSSLTSCTDSFELYIFHFAYHLVNPELQKVQMNAWLYSDSLYLNLTEAYLTELLPCDRSTVLPSVPFNFGVLQGYSASFGPYGSLQRMPNLQSPSRFVVLLHLVQCFLFKFICQVLYFYLCLFGFRSAYTRQLLRQSVVQQGSSSGSLHSSPATAVTSTRTEIWRSETVAQVFVDFWLSHGEGEVGSVFGASGSPQRVSYQLCI